MSETTFPSLVPGRVGCDAGCAHHQHSKQDQINITAAMVLTGLVVCQCYRGSVYVQHSTQGYSDPQFLGYVDHMPKVLEAILKRKARKMKLGEKSRRLRLWRTLQDRLESRRRKSGRCLARLRRAYNNDSMASINSSLSGRTELPKLPTTRPARDNRYLWKFQRGYWPASLARAR